MRALQFTLPVIPGKSIVVQEDILPRFYPYLHRHQEMQLVWIKQGSGTLLVETGIHDFKENDIFLIASNQSHLFRSIDTVEGIMSLSVFFDLKAQLDSLFKLPELQSLNTFLKSCEPGFKLLEPNRDHLFSNFQKLKNAKDLERFILFLELLNELAEMKRMALTETSPLVFNESEGFRIRRIYDYILKNYTTTISLNEMAELAHLTPQAFCRYFKKHTGITLVEFINSLRINEVQKLLLNSNYNAISEAAYACGFNSLNHFNRVFKKHTGVPPKEYLLSFKNSSG